MIITTRKNLLMSVLTLCLLPTYPARASTKDDLPLFGAATLAAVLTYISVLGYGKWIHSRAESSYKHALVIAHEVQALKLAYPYTVVDMRIFSHAMAQEVLRAHDVHCSSYWFNRPTLEHYPYVRYAKNLDAIIFKLSLLSYCTLLNDISTQLHQLAQDLRTVRSILVTDYAYIQEHRLYQQEQAKHAVAHQHTARAQR